jgi:hypothetical protein
MRTGRWVVEGGDTAPSSNGSAQALVDVVVRGGALRGGDNTPYYNGSARAPQSRDDGERWECGGFNSTQNAEGSGDPGSSGVRMVPASVEDVARSHYLRSGWSAGLHCENALPLTLFGMLFWDALFTPVPGQLSSPVQDAPVDLWDARGFYARRRVQIDQTLGRVRDGHTVHLLRAAHAAYWGTPVVGLTWGRFSLDFLCDVAEGLGGAAVAAICLALATDYSCWSHGFPDLLLVEPGRSTAPLDASARHDINIIPSAEVFNTGSRSDAAVGTAAGPAGVASVGTPSGVDRGSGAAAGTVAGADWEPSVGKPSHARIKLVEVKGPGDRLSDAQVAWIGLLIEHGVAVEVCRVKAGR